MLNSNLKPPRHVTSRRCQPSFAAWCKIPDFVLLSCGNSSRSSSAAEYHCWIREGDLVGSLVCLASVMPPVTLCLCRKSSRICTSPCSLLTNLTKVRAVQGYSMHTNTKTTWSYLPSYHACYRAKPTVRGYRRPLYSYIARRFEPDKGCPAEIGKSGR